MTRKLIGSVGVDSGQVMIVDPCYVLEDDFQPDSEPTGLPYDECCRITLGEEGAGLTSFEGVVSSTAYGDGCYPVYATIGSDGRILSLEILFDDFEEDDEEKEFWDDDEDD